MSSNKIAEEIIKNVDYSLYLVTDSDLVPRGRNFYTHVEEALKGGVTIVQLREKKLDTGPFIERANKLHAITQKYGVPLIINDRVDVALASNAEGVHIGADDMDATRARQLIGPDKILGVSVRNRKEFNKVVKKNEEVRIDYIGVGAVYSTNTKAVKVPPLGTDGAQQINVFHNTLGLNMKCVLIGGINESNIQEVWRDTVFVMLTENDFAAQKGVDGLAIVSDIMGSYNPKKKVEELISLIETAKHTVSKFPYHLKPKKSLTHFITNSVVQNFSANVCIATGGSPIMSEFNPEFEDLTKIDGAGLVLNMGTPTVHSLKTYKNAIRHYSANRKLIVFDPVGCSATSARKNLAASIMQELALYPYVIIKGNKAEIFHLAGIKGTSMHGVDSDDTKDIWNHQQELKQFVINRKKTLVITGEVDHIIIGTGIGRPVQWYAIDGGHKLMAKVTGSGCALGGVIARYASGNEPQMVPDSIVFAVTIYKEAGFRAAQTSDGPGTFATKFLDELYKLENSKNKNLKNTLIWHKTIY